jgi:hypothetical protein
MLTSADTVRPYPSSHTSSQNALASSRMPGSRSRGSRRPMVADGGGNVSDETALIQTVAASSQPNTAVKHRTEAEMAPRPCGQGRALP